MTQLEHPEPDCKDFAVVRCGQEQNVITAAKWSAPETAFFDAPINRATEVALHVYLPDSESVTFPSKSKPSTSVCYQEA